MIVSSLNIEHIVTRRLLLVPYTVKICRNIIDKDFSRLNEMGFVNGKGWPDEEVLESLPRVINNLAQVEAPTGFESWFIVKRDTKEIIGDIGFKGVPLENKPIDIGYCIIKEERDNGYAFEAAEGIIQWAFSQEGVEEITANCAEGNLPSLRLLTKLKFININQSEGMVYWKLKR